MGGIHVYAHIYMCMYFNKFNASVLRDFETVPNTRAKILFLLYSKMSHLRGKHQTSIHRPFGGLTGKMNSALKSGNIFTAYIWFRYMVYS